MFKRSLPFLILLTLVTAALPLHAAAASDRITLTLPADALRQALADILPLPLPLDSNHARGTLTIESIDSLRIHDSIISLKTMVSGHDLSVNTRVAGQDFRLKLGQVRMPMRCDVRLRFDPAGRILYLTPRFPPAGQGADPAATVGRLLASLASREYPVNLAHLQPLRFRIGGQVVPINVHPVAITAANDVLVLDLVPGKGQSR